MTQTQKSDLTGYPFMDRPWIKYYDKKPGEIKYPHKTLWQFIWDNNKNHLDDPVFQYFDKKITYRTFFENVKKTARALKYMGVESGDVVTVMSMHTPETLYVFYGLNYIGAVANMVYPSLSKKELSETIENTKSKLLFIMNKVLVRDLELTAQLQIPVILLPEDASMPGRYRFFYRIKNKPVKTENTISFAEFIKYSDNTGNAEQGMNPDDLAVIVYSSGTTGEPKGVCLSNYNINALAIQVYNGLFNLERGKTCLMILPLFIAFGVTQMHMLAGIGITSILQIIREPDSIIKNLFKYKPYIFLTGPALIPAFLEHKTGNLKNVTYFVGGGSGISQDWINQVNEKLHLCGSKAVYLNGYGMSEASSLLSASANEVTKKDSVGIPVIDTNVRIVNPENGKNCRIGETGELWFSTPNLMQGYLNRQKQTDEVITTDNEGTRWLHTGDLGTVDEDGFVFIKGRIKRIHITRGNDNVTYKLFPQRIEEVISQLNEVEQCGVTVRKHNNKINAPIAYISLNHDIPNEKARQIIQNHAEMELPQHMIPLEYHIIDKMPITPAGKINYRALEKWQ